RIVRHHRARYLAGIGTQVLLIDLAVLIDDEGHHSRVAIAGRVSKQRESSGHLARDDIAFGAIRRVGSLTGQQPVKVAVEGMRLASMLIAFAGRFSDKGTEGTLRLRARRDLPEQAVLRSCRAPELLSVLMLRRTVVQRGIIVSLGIGDR